MSHVFSSGWNEALIFLYTRQVGKRTSVIIRETIICSRVNQLLLCCADHFPKLWQQRNISYLHRCEGTAPLNIETQQMHIRSMRMDDFSSRDYGLPACKRQAISFSISYSSNIFILLSAHASQADNFSIHQKFISCLAHY